MRASSKPRLVPWFAAVLAAGEGRRFGGGKQTALLAGKPLVCWPVQAALEADMHGVLVVTGSHGPAVRRALPADPRVEALINPQPEKGMGGSLALAARRARDMEAAGLVMLLGDMPFVTARSIAQVAWAAEQAPAGAAAGEVGGERSHPVAFLRSHFEELTSLGGDRGARDVLARLRSGLILVTVDPQSRLDVDKLEDLAKADRLWQAARKP